MVVECWTLESPLVELSQLAQFLPLPMSSPTLLSLGKMWRRAGGGWQEQVKYGGGVVQAGCRAWLLMHRDLYVPVLIGVGGDSGRELPSTSCLQQSLLIPLQSYPGTIFKDPDFL